VQVPHIAVPYRYNNIYIENDFKNESTKTILFHNFILTFHTYTHSWLEYDATYLLIKNIYEDDEYYHKISNNYLHILDVSDKFIVTKTDKINIFSFD
jgi:hypothetical protein